MTKFGSAFMMKSPFKKHGEEFIKKAKELSKESGTPGDFDRDNPEVLEQLKKAKEAEAEHKGSPAEMKSPLHAPVTATQELTSDMYYQPRKEIDYENMVESFGKLGKAGRGFFGGKKKTDPVDDLSNKIQSQQKSDAQKKIEEQNIKSKTLQDNSQMKWVAGKDGKPGQFMRVDKNNNFYSIKPGDDYGKKVASISGKDDVYKVQKDKEDKAVFDFNKTIDINKNF